MEAGEHLGLGYAIPGRQSMSMTCRWRITELAESDVE